MTRDRSVVAAPAAAAATPLSPDDSCCPICFDEYEYVDDANDGDEAAAAGQPVSGSPISAMKEEPLGWCGLFLPTTTTSVAAEKEEDELNSDNDVETGGGGRRRRLDAASSSLGDHRRRPDRGCARRRRRKRRLRIDLDPCHHAYCVECLEAYFAHSIHTRKVPIPCPSVGSGNDCQQVVALASVLQVLDHEEVGEGDDHAQHDDEGRHPAELVRKLVRLHRLHEDPTLRCCPHCDEVLDVPRAGDGTTSPEHAGTAECCPSCGHAILEDPTTTDKSGNPEWHANEEWIQRSTKPCSHCGAPIHKDSGCDHVVCGNCHDDMCYQCGSHLHLTGRTIRTCTNCRKSYVDHRHNREYRIRLLLLLPFLLPGWILYVLSMTVLAVVTGCFCGFFMCGTMESSPHLLDEAHDEEVVELVDDDNENDHGAVIRPTDSSLTAGTAATSPSVAGSHHVSQPKQSSHLPPPPPVQAPLAPLLGIRRTVGYICLPILVYLGDLGFGWSTSWIEELETTSSPTTSATADAVKASEVVVVVSA